MQTVLSMEFRDTRAILNPEEGRKFFQVYRFQPGPALSFFIEHYWVVRWHLPKDSSFEQQVISYPAVHLVFEKQNTKIYGVETGVFTRKLQDSGQVFGIKFRPGGFYPFFKAPVSEFTNSALPFRTVFEEAPPDLERRILDEKEFSLQIKSVEAFLHQRIPPEDPQITLIDEIFSLIKSDHTINRVSQIVDLLPISKRSLQRLFYNYVGVSPK